MAILVYFSACIYQIGITIFRMQADKLCKKRHNKTKKINFKQALNLSGLFNYYFPCEGFRCTFKFDNINSRFIDIQSG